VCAKPQPEGHQRPFQQREGALRSECQQRCRDGTGQDERRAAKGYPLKDRIAETPSAD